MPQILRLSLAQTTSAKTHSENIEHLSHIVKDAARAGANMLALPEVVGMMNKDFEEARKSVTSAAQDPF
ncbi:MAG: carbon-nitrogen hydrolase family protein, partial [Paracoccaceae bacterium]